MLAILAPEKNTIAMAIYDEMTRQEDNDTYKYLVAIEKLYREIQKIERQLIILLKERRLQLETGFDTLLTREDAAQVLGMSVRQLDRLTNEKHLIRRYETIYGLRFRMGDIVAYSQMRCEADKLIPPKPFNPKSKRMSDLDKLMGQIIKFDLSHQPMSLD